VGVVVATRNELVVAWLRRPLTGAVGTTAAVARRAARDPAARAGLLEAARRARRLARERDPVGRGLEDALRLLATR
jgi:hypothetical protein